jgi:pyruvate dehydrogenase E2 component (dihydrolipoamide acetyltransferase)
MTVIELTPVQRVIASRMQRSSQEVPGFWASLDIDLTAILDARAAAPGKERPSVNDFLVRGVATTLAEIPAFNATFEEGKIVRHESVDVGVAVATDDALLVPVVRSADALSVVEIGRTIRAFADRARKGTLTPADLRGGSFTVSNLGMLGIRAFRAIVNVPQVAILAVGASRRAPYEAADGAVRFRDELTLTLTCDHRAVYGAECARFLSRLKATLEAHELAAPAADGAPQSRDGVAKTDANDGSKGSE